MRYPAVAGTFYPARERTLRRELENCFRTGPGRSRPEKGNRVKGLVSPHAGYTYSGPTAAFGFLAMADGGLPETVVVIGPNHTGFGEPVGISREDFQTPMGTMRNDLELANSFGGPFDEMSHIHEHSMEVQLPFVQYFSPSVKQVCISMGDQSPGTSEMVGRMVAKGIEETGRDVIVVASSDFTHCGANYGVSVPGDMNAGEYARSLDEPVIERLLAYDVPGAFSRKRELGTTACGLGPIAAMMTAIAEMGEAKGKLMDYRTSFDVMPARSAVGYASIIYT
jgi:AmmeMemoRadiSam system protein B